MTFLFRRLSDHRRPGGCVRLAISRLGPWVLLPFALYVAALPLVRPHRDLIRLMATGVLGTVAIVIPAIAVRTAEARWGRSVAAQFLAAVAGTATVLIAASSGVPAALAVAGLMLVAAYGYGRLLARWLDLAEEDRRRQGVPLVMAIGWAALIVIGLAAGTLGLLTRPVVAAAVLAGIVLALFPLPRGGPASPRAIPEFAPSPAPEQPALIWWWGLAALFLIGLVGAAAPEVRHDALTAHLPIAREFAARAAIVEMRQNTASYFQHNADLLYAMANVLLPGEAVPKFLHVFSGVAASLLVYDVGARMWNPRVGLAAAAVVAGTPLVWWVGGSAYTDLWTMLFGIGMLAGLVLYSRRPGAGRALLVGLMAGAAVGVKITAVIMVAPLAVVFLLRVARTRSAERPWLALTAFLVGVAATGAFWYVRAWLLTGNPVFPLLGGIFRGPYGGSGTTGSVAAIFGMGSTPWDFLLLPWRVTRFPGRFVEDGNIGIVYLTLVPAAVLAVARRQVPRFVAGVLAAAGLIWFLTAQYLRYFLPALPLAALIGAAGVFARSAAAPSPLVSALILTLVLSLGAGTWVAPGAAYFPYPVVARTMTRTAYLDRYLSGFTLAAYARSLPPSARIYSVGEDKAFLYGQFFVPASWYGRIGYGGLAGAVRTARTGAKIQTILTQAGFTHLIVYVPIAAGWGGPGSWIAREALWEEGPRLEDGADGYYLFDLRHPDGPRRRGPEVSVDLKTVTAAGFSSGQMPVQPGVLYALDARVRSGSPGAKARLAVQWIGEGGRELGPPTWREVESGSTWTRRALARSAPSGARHALVHLAPVGDGVQFDALRFYELR